MSAEDVLLRNFKEATDGSPKSSSLQVQEHLRECDVGLKLTEDSRMRGSSLLHETRHNLSSSTHEVGF